MSVLNKKISKYSSEQSGAFNVGTGTGQNRNIDLLIPSSLGVISLKDTFIQLRASIIPDPEYSDLVVPYFLKNKDSPDVPVRNVDIIRNCYLHSSNFGRLEDIRRVNVLRKNVQEHEEGLSSKFSKGQTLYNLTDPSTLRFESPFIEIHRGDGFDSKIVDAHLRVKMSDLFELGSVDTLDLGVLGDLRVHIELEEKGYFEVKSIDGSYYPKYEDENLVDNIDNVQSANVIELTYTYAIQEQIPFYEGQQIILAFSYFTPSQGPLDPIESSIQTTITNVSYFKNRDLSDNTMSQFIVNLTIDPPLPESTDASGNEGNYEELSLILVNVPDDANTDIQYLTCEIAVCHYLSPMEKMNMLEWTTYTTEEYTNAYLDLNKIFELESNCTAVYVMFANNNGLISNFKDHFAYRMRVDNVDMYEYDVEVNKLAEDDQTRVSHDALYWDGLTKLFTQTGKSLKCLVPALSTGSVDGVLDYTDEPDSQIVILGTPTSLTPLPKLFQLTIHNKMDTPQTDVNNIILFKNVQKSLKL
jgi:hypothetical protein